MTSDAKKELNILAASLIRGIRFIIYPLIALIVLMSLRFVGIKQDDPFFLSLQTLVFGALLASMGKLVAGKTTNEKVKKTL